MSAANKSKLPIDIFQVGEAAAAAAALRLVILDGPSVHLDAVAAHSNMTGSELVYLAMSVSTQLDRMHKAMEEAENA